MIEEYYPREEMQNLEQELWNLIMEDENIVAYTDRFNDLAIFCPNLVTLEYKRLKGTYGV